MKEPDDKGTLDAQLKPYLDGQDGVSAAYRQASEEQPPAGLDALILSAAREAVKQSAPGSKRRWGGYRVAASFMVGVLATSLYFNWQEGVDLADAPVASTQLSPRAAESSGSDGASAREAPQLIPEAVVQEVSTANRRIAAQGTTVAPAIPTFTPPLRQTSAAVRAELREAGAAQLEEIAANGAFIVGANANEPDLSYRATQEQWVAYIRSLSQRMSALSQAFDAGTVSLEEEMALFAEAYPDVDLEVALQGQADEEQ